MCCFNLWYQLKPCGELCVAMSHRCLENLDFTQFFDHFVFTPNAENVLEALASKRGNVSFDARMLIQEFRIVNLKF